MRADCEIDCLSWKDARRKLRSIVEDFLSRPHINDCRKKEREVNCKEKWFEYSMDFYCGSFLVVFATLTFSYISYIGEVRTNSNGDRKILIYRCQVASATIMMVGSIVSAYLTWRRRQFFNEDVNESQRKAILKYIASEEKHESSKRTSSGNQDFKSTTSSSHLSGTSLTDIYPVYRKSSAGSGAWCNLSALLLVRGDYVALQIGDIAPAHCQSLQNGLLLRQGERIVVHSENDNHVSIPNGRVTVPPLSPSLLSLCNSMQIYVVLTAPIEAFLRRPCPRHRSPQVHRQLQDMRKMLYLFSALMFVLTAAIISIRQTITPTDFSLIIHVPLLAAIGTLPIVTPIFLILLEVLGTARILVSVHPYSNYKSEHLNSNSLWLRYIFATITSRLSLQRWITLLKYVHSHFRYHGLGTGLIPIPPASMCLLEKLGVATAFCLIDDELACETNSIPQQLLIPSASGLKLLDLCPTYDEIGDESDIDSNSDKLNLSRRRNLARNDVSSSESEDSDAERTPGGNTISAPIRKLNKFRKRVRRQRSIASVDSSIASQDKNSSEEKDEVQFEDPLWWHHLPSLKCIGLACLLAMKENSEKGSSEENDVITMEEKLVRHITSERRRKQFKLLANCIGLKTNPNTFGEKGDLTPFQEMARYLVINTKMFRERITTDYHALGLEDSRNWGKLRTDSISVIVQDSRSKAYQLLTIGDPRIVTAFCKESWQGEILTILPLSSTDKQSILDISNDWNLADLDVAAFSYTPLPHTLASSFLRDSEHNAKYLIDNPSKDAIKEGVADEWATIENQIFLGVLGSSITPRKEIEKTLNLFGEAGIRFVYFSPRNMRRTKEVASQMGIDVAFNCSISLRPLEAGESDQYRMVSNYADWSVNAKLPHGVEAVRKHIQEVDNVPLLVHLYTDVTKENTTQMIEIFQDYHDTVISMGLSHLSRNATIFDTADLAIGVDVTIENFSVDDSNETRRENFVSQQEVDLVTAIATSSCVFRLRGPSSASYLPKIIETSRTSLKRCKSAISFVTSAFASYSFYILFCSCSVATNIPFIPHLGSALYIFWITPLTGLAMSLGGTNPESMKEVPPKNDESKIFGKSEYVRFYTNILLKSILPGILSQILWLIAYGELLLKYEPDFVMQRCENASSWHSIVRCHGLSELSASPAQTSAGVIGFMLFILCILISSASFLHDTESVIERSSITTNKAWIVALTLDLVLITGYLSLTLEKGCLAVLPWYFFLGAFLAPFLCLFCNERLKIQNRKNVKREVMMRRLQFETRLGMWSPK